MNEIIAALIDYYSKQGNDEKGANIKAAIYILACCNPEKFTPEQQRNIAALGISLPKKMNQNNAGIPSSAGSIPSTDTQQTEVKEGDVLTLGDIIMLQLNLSKRLNWKTQVKPEDCLAYFSDISLVLRFVKEAFWYTESANDILKELKIEDNPQVISEAAGNSQDLLEKYMSEYSVASGVFHKTNTMRTIKGILSLAVGGLGVLVGLVIGGPIGAVVGAVAGIAIGYISTKIAEAAQREDSRHLLKEYRDQNQHRFFPANMQRTGPVDSVIENLKNDCDVTLSR